MTSSLNRASTYVDFLIVQALLEDPLLHKKADDGSSMMSGIGGAVQNYVNNNIDPNDKVGSVINMLAPGVITTTLSMLGMGRISSFLVGLAARFFHLDVASILRSIGEKLKEALSGGKQMTSDQVHNIVQDVVAEHNTPATQEEAEDAARQQAAQRTEQPAQANDGVFARELRYAKLLSLAITEYEQEIGKKIAQRRGASAWDKFFSSFDLGKKGASSFMSRILSFLFRVFIASAGLMVAGDVMNHFLGRPNALDNPIRDGKPVGEGPASASALPASTQSKFPPNPSYQNIHHDTVNANWVENTPNNTESIGQMLINFAKEVYQGLDGKESEMQSSSRFQTLVDTIAWYNHMATNSPVVFIPRMFSTKKQLVDAFIDDVAAKTS
jgi:hypothetical protein